LLAEPGGARSHAQERQLERDDFSTLRVVIPLQVFDLSRPDGKPVPTFPGRALNGGGPAVFPPSPLEQDQPACKPGSVRREARAARATTIHLGRRLPGASSNLPGRPDPDTGPGHHRLRADARAVPIRFCSRWGLPCRFRCRKRGALLPHRFTLAVPLPFGWGTAVCSLWHFP